MALSVVLAGMNLDRDLLVEIRTLLEDLLAAGSEEALAAVRARVQGLLALDNWTPETLAAAYARVSRDPRSVTELRRVARAEVDRARRSNEAIIFGLGHSSVAEHAVFNFDVLGLSRLAVEVLERGRLSSYTEKSQRYILLEEDWVLPAEIAGTRAETPFREAVRGQQRFYRGAYERLLAQAAADGMADGAVEASEPAGRERQRRLEGAAKEDARYALPLATTVQLGMTINARGLEGLLSRCAAAPLAEVRALGNALGTAVAGLAPSLVKYVEPTPYRREGPACLHAAVAETVRAGDAVDAGTPAADAPPGASPEDGVRLVATTPDPDATLLTVLLHAAGYGSYDRCRARAGELEPQARRRILVSHLERLGPHDPVLREYEHLDLVFDLVVSASCFAQLKRHRMATVAAGPYDPALGITIPPSFAAAGLEADYRALAAEAAERAAEIAAVSRDAAPYLLINGHRRRVLLKLNARELYHFARLREDAHAQWDIRRVARRMVELARERMPLTLALACGKDRFDDLRRELFGG